MNINHRKKLTRNKLAAHWVIITQFHSFKSVRIFWIRKFSYSIENGESREFTLKHKFSLRLWCLYDLAENWICPTWGLRFFWIVSNKVQTLKIPDLPSSFSDRVSVKLSSGYSSNSGSRMSTISSYNSGVSPFSKSGNKARGWSFRFFSRASTRLLLLSAALNFF